MKTQIKYLCKLSRFFLPRFLIVILLVSCANTEENTVAYLSKNAIDQTPKQLGNTVEKDLGNLSAAYSVGLSGTTKLVPLGWCDDESWHDLPLVIKPGRYCIDGTLFEVRSGGVRFARFQHFSRYHIVDNGNVYEFLSAIAWAISHGNLDEGKAALVLEQQAKTQKLSLACGNTAILANYLLAKQGYESRMIGGVTLEEWNNFDDGHVLLEVKDKNGQWFLTDLSMNVIFRNRQNKPMNAWEVFSDFRKENFSGKLQIIARDAIFDSSGSKLNNYDHIFLKERVNTQEGLIDWYQRVLQVILVYEKNKWYFFSPDSSHIGKIEKLYKGSAVSLKRNNYQEKFY